MMELCKQGKNSSQRPRCNVPHQWPANKRSLSLGQLAGQSRRHICMAGRLKKLLGWGGYDATMPGATCRCMFFFKCKAQNQHVLFFPDNKGHQNIEYSIQYNIYLIPFFHMKSSQLAGSVSPFATGFPFSPICFKVQLLQLLQTHQSKLGTHVDHTSNQTAQTNIPCKHCSLSEKIPHHHFPKRKYLSVVSAVAEGTQRRVCWWVLNGLLLIKKSQSFPILLATLPKFFPRSGKLGKRC